MTKSELKWSRQRPKPELSLRSQSPPLTRRCPLFDLHALWNRREEIKSLIREFDRIKNTVDKATKDGDELYLELHNSVVSDFQKVRASLVRAVPYAVCTCNGRKEIKCSLCRGRGFLSRFLWVAVPKEIKDMRARKVVGK